ncbi:uncharacterized protein PRCAT00001381001 [Priceomyces carsonii]|uniref:uncharacterized protein n=1 Tax=Priceomyces carsonii TaxID=28549 RepID=UPI002EDAFC82|nr:unnamed protein product [Priceomyces carsonii]
MGKKMTKDFKPEVKDAKESGGGAIMQPIQNEDSISLGHGHNEDDPHSIASIPTEVVREHNKHIIRPPSFTTYAISSYLKSRFSTLFVSKEELTLYSLDEVFNPFRTLSELTLKQWNFFFLGLSAWTLDAFDFFAVSLNVAKIAEDIDSSVKEVTWGITLVLMLRSIGSIGFGLWGDRVGRRWPYMVNLFIIMIIQIGSGFIKTYLQFLGVRAIFGMAMGGLYGTCYAIASEDCPKNARGIVSGMFQQGYALGYLLAVVFTRALVDTTAKGWRTIFWFSAGPAAVLIVWRYFTPETDTFHRQKKKLEEEAASGDLKGKAFAQQGKKAIKQYWLVVIYCILMMSGFNFMSHGSQDLYPTLLTLQYGFSSDRSTVTNSVANLGAIFGGIVVGHWSTFIGRRMAIILACILGGCMIYPWAFIDGTAINAGAFFLQAGVQGAWGVIPIHLAELSPPQFKAFVTGTSYQLGNLCSSASSTIEATIGERFPLSNPKHGADYDYAKTMSIFMGCVFAYVIFIVFFGPENRGADLSVDRDEYIDEYGTDAERRSFDSVKEKPTSEFVA